MQIKTIWMFDIVGWTQKTFNSLAMSFVSNLIKKPNGNYIYSFICSDSTRAEKSTHVKVTWFECSFCIPEMRAHGLEDYLKVTRKHLHWIWKTSDKVKFSVWKTEVPRGKFAMRGRRKNASEEITRYFLKDTENI